MTATETKNARAAYEAVRTHEAIKRDAHERVELEPGDAYPQGDVIFARLDREPKRKATYAGKQLAPGETQGSRHVAEGDVDIYTPDEAAALAIVHRLFPKTKSHRQFLGPVVKAASDWCATHPEHGDRTFPAGVYQVVYQRTWLAWHQEIQRQMD